MFAGSGSAGSTNGAASLATFREPSSVAVDANGNVFVVDRVSNQIRQITSGESFCSFCRSSFVRSPSPIFPFLYIFMFQGLTFVLFCVSVSLQVLCRESLDQCRKFLAWLMVLGQMPNSTVQRPWLLIPTALSISVIILTTWFEQSQVKVMNVYFWINTVHF